MPHAWWLTLACVATIPFDRAIAADGPSAVAATASAPSDERCEDGPLLELVFTEPDNGTVLAGEGLTVAAALPRESWSAACGDDACAARIVAWRGDPARGGVETMEAAARVESGARSVELRATGVRCAFCAMTCWLTVSLTREDKVVAATRAPLVVRSSAPPATPTNDLSAFGSRDRLGDGACAALAWTDQKYPDAMCAAASPLAYERHACAYMLGDMLGAPRLALGGDDYYYSTRAVETAFQGATAARRAAIRRAFGAGSVAARYYARVAATSGDFAWTAHPDGAAAAAAVAAWVHDEGSRFAPPPADCVVVHLRSGDRSRRAEPLEIGALPGVAQYARIAARVCRDAACTRVIVVAAAHHDTLDGLRAVRDDVREFCAVVARGTEHIACAHRPPDTADGDLAYMAAAAHLVVHFGGYSALAAVLCRGQVVGGPLFRPYAAGVRAARRRAGMDTLLVVCAPPRAIVALVIDVAPVGPLAVYAPAHDVGAAARAAVAEWALADADAGARLEAALEARLAANGATTGPVVHAVGAGACVGRDAFWRPLDARGFAVLARRADVDTPDGLVPPDAVVGDAVMLCLDAATGDIGAVVAAADAADARGLHLAIAAPSALAAAATERGVTFVPLDTLDRDAFQRGFDDLLTGLERPTLVSLADLEAMTTCL